MKTAIEVPAAQLVGRLPATSRGWLILTFMPPAIWAVLAMLARLPVIDGHSTTVLLVLLIFVGTCAYKDAMVRKIPNWATYPAFLWALVLSATGTMLGSPAATENRSEIILWLSQFPVPIGDALAGALVCFLIMLLIHSTSKGGAGDVKLATAIGAFLGVKLGLLAICYTFILAGVVSLGIAIWVLGPLFVVKAFGRWVGSFFLPLLIDKPDVEQASVLQRSLPLGVFFALGTLLAILDLPGVNP